MSELDLDAIRWRWQFLSPDEDVPVLIAEVERLRGQLNYCIETVGDAATAALSFSPLDLMLAVADELDMEALAHNESITDYTDLLRVWASDPKRRPSGINGQPKSHRAH